MIFRYCGNSGKSATIRESNHGSGVWKDHYAKYFVPKSSVVHKIILELMFLFFKNTVKKIKIQVYTLPIS